MAKPTVDDYRPNGKYYQSVIVCFEGNESCPPINTPYPPSEDFAKLGEKHPFFKAYLEEQVRRNKGKKRINTHESVAQMSGPLKKFHYEVRWTDGDKVKYLTHPHTFIKGLLKREERTLAVLPSSVQPFNTREEARQANDDMDWRKHSRGKNYIVRVSISERIVT